MNSHLKIITPFKRTPSSLVGQVITTISDRANVKIVDWLSNLPSIFNNDSLMNEYETKYGELTEDNFKNVLVGISDTNQVSIIPMEDISGYIFEISGRV